MNSQSAIRNPRSKIVIVGAGPAGSSLAIRLAQAGFETVLIERERFPRQKLCGEFISPECLAHFESLGVLDSMLAAGGDRISETRFFEAGGRSVTVPSSWLGDGGLALSLSRAEMDDQLLRRAREVGAGVLEGATVNRLEIEDNRVRQVIARSDDGRLTEIDADIFVDATGRAGALSKLLEKQDRNRPSSQQKPAFIGFKAHIAGANLDKGVCEIYSFQGGYAGLSNVENKLGNLCFLTRAETVRSFSGGAAEVVANMVLRNKRAAETLQNFTLANEWLAVSINRFGTKSLAPAANLFTIGDAASFIDPFTGSGMIMALESSDVLANVIMVHRGSPELIGSEYLETYRRRFSMRLRVCSILRRTAFMPRLATAVVSSLGVSSTARRFLARATRR
jgi:menaquinone-9 beta-reductase